MLVQAGQIDFRVAMAAAEVGDDVYGEDPTVNRLETTLAERLGKETAVFAPTGTQSNLLGLMSHCERGDEYIVGQQAHTYKSEGGGAAVLGSIQPQPLPNQPDGTIRLEDIAAAAAVLKGRKVHPDVRFIVTPGSREILIAATQAGYIQTLHEANCIVTNANCGACPGLHGGLLSPGDVAITSITRNFEGRMGPGGEIYLASPATVAASAVEGRIASPVGYV